MKNIWPPRRVSPAALRKTKPHIVIGSDGRWGIYRTAWKAQFPGLAACIRAPDIGTLTARVLRDNDGWRFGAGRYRAGEVVA